MNTDKIQIAATILKVLLKDKQITKTNNSELYDNYYFDSEVKSALHSMLEGMDLYVYIVNNILHLSVKKENPVFSYSNEDMKLALKIGNNAQLYLCYFIMYVVMYKFYKDSSMSLQGMYISSDYVLNETTTKLKSTVATDKDLENIEGFAYMEHLWSSCNDYPITSSETTVSAERGKVYSKIGYVNSVFSFFVKEGLLRQNKEERTYSATSRFDAIVENYFSDRKNKSFLNKLILISEEDD